MCVQELIYSNVEHSPDHPKELNRTIFPICLWYYVCFLFSLSHVTANRIGFYNPVGEYLS